MLSKIEIEKIKEKLLRKFNLEKIILFGSQARGTSDSKSDIDLLILVKKILNRKRMMLEMDKNLSGINYARDIIILTTDEYEINKHIPGTVARYAYKEGKEIYAN